MSVTAAIPEVGQIVRVRQRLYLVEGLVARARPQDSTLVELSCICIEDDAQGQELAVLWERELDAAILTGEEWARLAQRGFDSAEYFSAYLNTLRWNCVTSTDATLLQSPFRAGIRRVRFGNVSTRFRASVTASFCTPEARMPKELWAARSRSAGGSTIRCEAHWSSGCCVRTIRSAHNTIQRAGKSTATCTERLATAAF